MKRSWKSLAKQFNQLKLSERRLMIITSVVVVFVLWSLLVWEPLVMHWGERSKKLVQLEGQIEALDQSIERLVMAAQNDPNDALRYELETLIKKIKLQQDKIASITSALITPEKMTGVFEKLLSNSSLRLNSVLNSEAEGIEIPGQKTETALLYEHGLSLEMEGSYVSVLNYIRHLENQNWKLYWDELIYKTTEYPQGELTLKVHTLSTSDHVLGF